MKTTRLGATSKTILTKKEWVVGHKDACQFVSTLRVDNVNVGLDN